MPACPACGTENSEHARFCVDCGASLALRCASCGEELPGAVRFCPHCGAAIGPVESAGDVRERKLVTVLFADVTGSTSLGERLDPERLRDVLDTFFTAMREEIEAEGGTVEKYIGDAVMAVFGVPVAHEDDPVRALRAAIAMQRRLTEVNRELASVHDVELAIRIGVNTGEVLATASPRPEEGRVAGDAVNVAARLEQAAEPGQVVVSERTASAARGFGFASLGALTLKGKHDPFEAMLLEQAAGAPAPGAPDRGVPGLQAPMVGRDQELDLLATLYERAAGDRRPHLATIYGEPGVGKSRLTREFLTLSSAREPRPIVLRGRCLPYGEGVTYWPFAEILKTWAGVTDSDPQDATLTKIRDAGAALIERSSASDPERVAAALAYTAGVEDPRVDFRQMEPRQVRRMIHDAWRSFLSALALDATVVVVVEDIHWADGALLDLLEELVDRVQGGVVFLCPARPELTEHRPEWGGGRRNVSGISLEPLEERHALRLVSMLLDVDDLPERVRARILERAGGNPFFLEEIVRGMMDSGSIVQDSGRWRAAPDLADVEIPDTVQGVLAARIDLLAPEEKRTLQCAAVIGRIFWPTPVELLLQDARADLTLLLRRLTDRDLVMERLGSQITDEHEYIFKHILTRDVAYETLPRRDRARAHAAVADWIDNTAGGRRGEFAQLLAYHYERAYRGEQEDPRGDPARQAALRHKAFTCLLVAAQESRSRYAIEKALALAEAALAIADGPVERSRALELRALTALSDYRGDLCHDSFKEAVDLLVDAGSDDHEAIARLCAGVTETPTRWPGSMSRPPPEEQVRRYVDLGLEHAGDTDSPTLVRLLSTKGFGPFAFGSARAITDAEFREAREAGRRAADMAKRLNRPDLESAALDGLAGSAGLLEGDYAALTPIVDRRIELAQELEDPWEVGDIYSMTAWHWALIGDFPAAIEWADRGMARTDPSAQGLELHSLSWRAFAEFQLGRWDEVMVSLARGESLLGERTEEPPYFTAYLFGAAAIVTDARNDPPAERLEGLLRRLGGVGPEASNMLLACLTLILARRGDSREATELLGALQETPMRMFRPFTDQVGAAVLAASERWSDVPAFVESSRRYAAHAGIRSLPPHLDRLDGQALLAHGDALGAIDRLERAADGFRRLGCRWEGALTQLALADALVASGQPSPARGPHAEATLVFEELRSVRDIARAAAVAARLG